MNKKLVGLIILVLVLIMFGVGLFLALYQQFQNEVERNEEIQNIVITQIVAKEVNCFDYKDYLIRRAYNVNNQYAQNIGVQRATKEQIEERINYIFKYVDKHLDGNIKYVIDIYSIIEHETRFINFYSLDNGLSFGVPSIQFSTIRGMVGEYTKTELRQNIELQIEGAVLYYKKMLSHFNNRDYAIVGYNRGYNINLYPSQYTYWQKVDRIRREVNQDIGR